LLSLFTANFMAKEHSCSILSKTPYLEKGCEGEACSFFHYDYALKEFKIYEKPATSSTIVGKIKKCEHLKIIEPFYWRISFAKTKVIRVDDELKKHNVNIGDILIV